MRWACANSPRSTWIWWMPGCCCRNTSIGLARLLRVELNLMDGQLVRPDLAGQDPSSGEIAHLLQLATLSYGYINPAIRLIGRC